jgi:outer membrane biosynthesis protein TonB
MKKNILLIVIVFISFKLSAYTTFPSDTSKKHNTTIKKHQCKHKKNVSDTTQQTSSQQSNTNHPPSLSISPSYKGGNQAMLDFIAKNLNYPVEAVKRNINGNVDISMIITKEGKLTDFKVVKFLGFGCDEEALRILKIMPNWNAGKNGKEIIDTPYIISIEFKH